MDSCIICLENGSITKPLLSKHSYHSYFENCKCNITIHSSCFTNITHLNTFVWNNGCLYCKSPHKKETIQSNLSENELYWINCIIWLFAIVSLYFVTFDIILLAAFTGISTHFIMPWYILNIFPFFYPLLQKYCSFDDSFHLITIFCAFAHGLSVRILYNTIVRSISWIITKNY